MYYQGNSEIQADGLQTLYLMNPNNYNAYSDSSTQQQSGNMLILNYPAGNGINFEHLPNGHQQPPPSQRQQQQHHLVGVPLHQAGHISINHHRSTQEMHTPRGGGGSGGGGGSDGSGGILHFHQSLWSSLDQENGSIRPGVVVGSTSGGGGSGQPEVSVAQLGYHHLPMVSPTRQGLSLSLSSQQHGFRPPPPTQTINQVGNGSGNFQGGGACSSLSGNSFVMGSKYIKAAQELLDEVVSIAAKEIKSSETEKKDDEKTKTNSRGGESSSGVDGDQTGAAMGGELSAAQKQEIQMKKAKLIAMIDEVDQRYAQYHHQMQVVVTSFEQATGVGSARSYTQLALQTISKQFRCLKDAISSQIKAASKSLGEEEILEGKIHGGSTGSRLKFVDQQLRQQRALQHFGMIQTNNVWRPQRGLPERAVSVLRAWLFEHFLHPYPKDSDKIMLAKQTGLTRSQVSNWFINARVRLWKPMVEEMYTEEMKNQETNNNASESNKQDHSTSTKSTSPKDVMNMTMMPLNEDNSDNNNNTAFSITSDHDKRKNPTDLSEISRFGLVSEKNPKRIRQAGDGHHMGNIVPIGTMISEEMMGEKYGEKESLNELGIGNGLIGPFSFGDLENFNQEFHGGGGGGVSLTLGLPPSDQSFFTNQSMELRNSLEMGSSGQGSFDQRVHKHHHHHQGPPHHMNIGYNETLHFPNS